MRMVSEKAWARGELFRALGASVALVCHTAGQLSRQIRGQPAAALHISFNLIQLVMFLYKFA